MSNTRNLADLLDSGGDIKSSALDNVPATDISGKLNTSGGTLTGTLIMESTDAGNSAEPELILYRNSPSPASGDYLGQIQFKGENANGGSEIYAKVTGKISDPTHSSEDGLIETAIKGDGSFTIVSRQKADELQLINGVNLDVDGNIAVGGTVDIGSVGSVTSSGADLKITGTDDIFFNVAGASNNILQLYGGSSANDQSKFDSHVHPLTDNSKDLGNATERWKDLYLSGGLKVGGTGSANTLDDYEEGTWTPGLTVGTATATLNHYTKIGRVVTVSLYLSGFSNRTSTSPITVTGLPYTALAGVPSGVAIGRYISDIDKNHCYVENTTISFYGFTTSNWSQLDHNMLTSSNSALYLSATYQTT